MAIKNLYYGDEQHLDLSKFREDAVRTSRGDYRTEPQGVILHLHKKDAPCEGREHEVYDAVKDVS